MHGITEGIAVGVSNDASKSTEPRLNYIDTLRGLASIQVLLSHSMLAFFLGVAMASPSSGRLDGYLAATPLYFAIDGASAVCIFFVLSGYVLTPLFTHSQASGGTLIGSRLLRLGVPAIAGCAFSAILFQVFGGDNVTASVIGKSQWLSDGWRPAADLWILKDALVNGLILGFQDSSVVQWFGFPAASLASMSDSYVTPLWTLSVEFYGSILVLFLARSRSWMLVVLAAIILDRTYMLCFIAGHVATRFELGGKRVLAPWPVSAVAAILGLAVCVSSHFWTPAAVVKFCEWPMRFLPPCPLANPAYLMRVYGATVFTLGVMQCGPIRTLLSHRRLRSLGGLSFPIYLTHWPIIFGVGSFSLLLFTPWVGALPARLLALLISIGVTLFAAKGFEAIDRVALNLSRDWRRRKFVSDETRQ